MRLFLFIFLFSALPLLAQSNGEYLDRFNKFDKFVKSKGITNVNSLSLEQFRSFLRTGAGIGTTVQQAQFLRSRIQKLDYLIQMGTTGAGTIKTALPFLTTNQAMKLSSIIANRGRPQPILAAIIAANGKFKLFDLSELLDEFRKISQRPSRPDSPSNRSIRRVIKRGNFVQKTRLPKPSGDYLGNMSAAVNYNYTEYEDTNINEEGNIHDWSFSLHGTILENTDLSFSFLMNEIEARGDLSDTDADSRGGDFLLLHKLNDNFGLGTYGFYQETNYRDGDDHAIGKGFGLIFTTVHDLGADLQLSTVHTLTRAYYEFGHDNLYIGNVSLTRFWGDSFTTTVSVSFTDSIRSETVGDNTYWTFGGNVGYRINEHLHMYVGYETDRKLDDYHSRTWSFGITYYF